MMILEPGVYSMRADAYHADPVAAEASLSSSIARLLIDRSPLHAWTAHPKLNPDCPPDEGKASLDLGSCAHELLLGRGKGVHVIDADDFRKKATQEERDEARAAGRVPVLRRVFEQAEAMAIKARTAIAASPHLGPFWDGGKSEQVLVWKESNGRWCRAMVDRLMDRGTLVFDYKTTAYPCVPQRLSRHVFDMGYDFQLAFYVRGLSELDDAGIERRGLLLFQETDPPYSVCLMTIDPAGRTIAMKRVQASVEKWHECMTSGTWPDYPGGLEYAMMPAWLEAQWLAREIAEDDERPRPSAKASMEDYLVAG